MGFFKAIANWFRGFFKEAAKTATGVVVEEMQEAALTIVREAENAPNVHSKYEYAFKELKKKYPNAKTAAINLAINLAVAIIDPAEK